jgi:hypothetical protein
MPVAAAVIAIDGGTRKEHMRPKISGPMCPPFTVSIAPLISSATDETRAAC